MATRGKPMAQSSENIRVPAKILIFTSGALQSQKHKRLESIAANNEVGSSLFRPDFTYSSLGFSLTPFQRRKRTGGRKRSEAGGARFCKFDARQLSQGSHME